jgi:hypothetical protein|tara:strand:+ start:236 stop:592 length:357 start_codon:yes stop_codon:yes gene_type:complete
MSYSKEKNIAACNGNKKGFIYALVSVRDDSKLSFITFEENAEYYKSWDVVYIGLTNNPMARFAKHRSTKSKKIGMVIFDTADSPAEGKYKEAKAIYRFIQKWGESPKFQAGDKTYAGA